MGVRGCRARHFPSNRSRRGRGRVVICRGRTYRPDRCNDGRHRGRRLMDVHCSRARDLPGNRARRGCCRVGVHRGRTGDHVRIDDGDRRRWCRMGVRCSSADGRLGSRACRRRWRGVVGVRRPAGWRHRVVHRRRRDRILAVPCSSAWHRKDGDPRQDDDAGGVRCRPRLRVVAVERARRCQPAHNALRGAHRVRCMAVHWFSLDIPHAHRALIGDPVFGRRPRGKFRRERRRIRCGRVHDPGDPHSGTAALPALRGRCRAAPRPAVGAADQRRWGRHHELRGAAGR